MANIKTASNVTLIPAKRVYTDNSGTSSLTKKLRVAAYCRVSTDEDNQQNSYKTQIAYYSSYIVANPDWELVSIFADEGLSGTLTKNRTQFNRMIRLCRKGKVDIVLCKSISRFARNTVDCLEYVRELKALGIAVIFEKENINTMSVNSEFTISLYASFAQAESESISKNITWGIEKAYREGNVIYRLDNTLGYRKGEDGRPKIVEEEAVHIREIFKMFSEGHSMGEIANTMTEKGVVRRCGSSNWSRKNVEIILRNEKYAGKAILQKTYTKDCLTHERAKNTGQKPKYIVEEAHDAIVDPETYEKVRLEFARRSLESEKKKKALGRHKYHTHYSLNRLLICPYCGSNYRRTVWTYKGESYGVWRCANRLEGGKGRCDKSVSLKESDLHRSLVNLINAEITEADRLEHQLSETEKKVRLEMDKLADKVSEINAGIEGIRKKRDEILGVISSSSFDLYSEELKALNTQEQEKNEERSKAADRMDELKFTLTHMKDAAELFRAYEPQEDFDEVICERLIERIEVLGKDSLRVRFRGGFEAETSVEKEKKSRDRREKEKK